MNKPTQKTHEIFYPTTVILYYGNGITTEHRTYEDPYLWAERAKRIFKAQSYFILNKN